MTGELELSTDGLVALQLLMQDALRLRDDDEGGGYSVRRNPELSRQFQALFSGWTWQQSCSLMAWLNMWCVDMTGPCSSEFDLHDVMRLTQSCFTLQADAHAHRVEGKPVPKYMEGEGFDE